MIGFAGTAPALNASSYRGGGMPFFAFFCSIVFAPFLSSLRLFFLSVNLGMRAMGIGMTLVHSTFSPSFVSVFSEMAHL